MYVYLSKFKDVFVKIANCICPNFQLRNTFVGEEVSLRHSSSVVKSRVTASAMRVTTASTFWLLRHMATLQLIPHWTSANDATRELDLPWFWVFQLSAFRLWVPGLYWPVSQLSFEEQPGVLIGGHSGQGSDVGQTNYSKSTNREEIQN